MHSSIFQIDAEPIPEGDWATDIDIADDCGRIEGTDYFGALDDEEERSELISDFFTDCFPDGSFTVESNEPGRTAVVRFVGDIAGLYRKWAAEIKEAADRLTPEGMDSGDLYDVRSAVKRPFDLWSKFYMPGWSGGTGNAESLMGYLRHLSGRNGGKPFALYVGQVFDYHV